jgi:DNA-binding NtrC family response regulator
MAEAAFSLGDACRIAILTRDVELEPAIQQCLASSFHTTIVNSDVQLAKLLEEVPIKAIVVDLDGTGEESEQGVILLDELRRELPDVTLIAFSRSRQKSLRRLAEQAGADAFFVAPVDFHAVRHSLVEILDSRELEAEQRWLREEAASRNSFCELIGGSEAMRLVYDAIARVANGATTVAIRGESGTGKELVARAIVASGSRRDKPFISVNCAALPETLIEAELFGHEKGSFTGAHESRPGHIEAAHGGTLFLDEIGTLGLALQSKLLRVLEQHVVQRIGSKVLKKIDFRLITATNEDLEQAVHAGRFREDLYYRINVVPIHLPPLRERAEDIPLLIDHFVRMYSAANQMAVKRLDPDAVEVLEDYSWPGNIRELENVIQRLVLMTSGPVITVRHLPQQLLVNSTTRQEALLIPEQGISFDEEMARIEVAYLQAALRRTNGKKTAAAALLHIDRQKMKYLCRKYGISVNN